MFICGLCPAESNVIGAGVQPQMVTVEVRAVIYRYSRNGVFVREVPGHEIARQVQACPSCYRSHSRRSPVVVNPGDPKPIPVKLPPAPKDSELRRRREEYAGAR